MTRLTYGWSRRRLLKHPREQGDSPIDEHALAVEVGECEPSKQHLDRLCRIYRTRRRVDQRFTSPPVHSAASVNSNSASAHA